MSENLEDQMGHDKRERVVKHLDKMIKSGRVTESEAAKLRAATDPRQFDTALADIRVRHARPKLNAAVDGGHMTKEEADTYLARIKKGEHPRGLRAHLAKVLPRDKSSRTRIDR